MSSRNRRMRISLITVILVVAVFVLAPVTGLVSLSYLHIIEDKPLNSPITVAHIDGHRLILQDGRTMEVEDWVEGRGTITETLSQSDFQVDLEALGDGGYAVWARQDGWICGTGWTQPIRIPIFRVTAYRNRRQPIGFAKETEGQQEPQRDAENVDTH